VANLREVKNHAGLFRALSELKRTRSDFTAVLAGTGPLRKPLEELSRELGISENVRFLGQAQDIPSFLSAVDAGVLNSRHEGFPNALLEYMAAGLPVVSTAVGGCREIVLDGVTGFLIPPQDESALAERLRALLDDRPAAERMGAAGRKRAETEFSMDRMVSFHDSMYRTLAVA
jgi:glycosyltransferase involved in cell wall biosynthesis